MGLFKYICNKFKCTSQCTFNNELFDIDLHKLSLSNFELKNKDMVIIHRILNKRKLIKKLDINVLEV